MKNLFTILTAIALTTAVHSQNYLISFKASGSDTVVESVIIENLTQGTSLTIDGADQLRLLEDITGINPLWDNKDNVLRIFPNPAKEHCTVEFEALQTGVITSEVFDISGKKVLQESKYVEKGTHLFQIHGLDQGVYVLTVKSAGFSYTGKIISQGDTRGIAQIIFAGQIDKPANTTRLKSANEEVRMQYNEGDRLKLTGISGKYSTVVMDIPAKRKSISFNFIACTDADENNYPVVSIGDQIWMAADLKTTLFPSGMSIPLVEDFDEWDVASPTDMAYCYFQNSSSNGDIYGALYTWTTAMNGAASSANNPSGIQGVCPSGWHLPSEAEWIELTDYLGGKLVAGGKMKAVGTTLWKSPNKEATDETGFGGNPGGYRTPQGHFIALGEFASYTSASDLSGWVITRYLDYNASKIIESTYNKTAGLTVRCVKN